MRRKTALIALATVGSVLVGASMAQAEGNQVVPGNDNAQWETYHHNPDGTYVPEDRTDWRDLDSDSPAEIETPADSPVAAFANGRDESGCYPDDLTNCQNAGVTVGAAVSGAVKVAVRGDWTRELENGRAEVYVEDDTDGDVVASAVNQLAAATNPDYSTPGGDDDGHDCGGPEGSNDMQACDDETNVVLTQPEDLPL